MWYLEHQRENKRITCRSYDHALREFYFQWRDGDGSIPWTIKYQQ